MSHEIDITNDVASFASAREDAWHRLGTVLPDVMTAQEALDAAHLTGWDVRKRPLTTTDEHGNAIDVVGKHATVRTNPITGLVDYLGVVGDWYTPIQNEAHAELLNALVDQSGAHFETAGALRGGRETFLTMKLPETMTIGGADKLDTYIAALNSHDGTAAFRFMITPVRVVCANTQAMAIRAAKSTFSIRHTAGATNVIAEAREALGLTFKFLDVFQSEADRMIQTALTDKAFRKITDQLWDVDRKADTKEDRAQRGRRETSDKVIDLFHSSDTLAECRNTAWAGYQAITEWFDHFEPVTGAKLAHAAETRALRTLSSRVTQTKARAFDLCAAV